MSGIIFCMNRDRGGDATGWKWFWTSVVIRPTCLVLSQLLFCASGFGAECGVPASDVGLLKATLSRDPQRMARLAVQKGDYSLIGVAGYSVVVPLYEDASCRVEEVRVLVGTTDFLCSREHGELVHNASDWARRYNAIIRDSSQQIGRLLCAK